MRPWNVATSIGRRAVERVGRLAGRFQEARPLDADVLESDDEYLLVFDAPGVTRSDVQVRYVEDEVLVRIDRFRPFYEGFEMRFPGRGLSFDGRVALPDDTGVDPEAATATLSTDGVLRIHVPKTESTPADERGGPESIDVD